MRPIRHEQLLLFNTGQAGAHSAPNYRLGATLAVIAIVIPWSLVAVLIWALT